MCRPAVSRPAPASEQSVFMVFTKSGLLIITQDYYGKKKQTTKRGFKTKREASEWEAAEKLKRNFSLDMPFSKFYEIYEADLRHRIKQTTWENKNIIITTKILPYFGERKMTEITPKDVRHW